MIKAIQMDFPMYSFVADFDLNWQISDSMHLAVPMYFSPTSAPFYVWLFTISSFAWSLLESYPKNQVTPIDCFWFVKKDCYYLSL